MGAWIVSMGREARGVLALSRQGQSARGPGGRPSEGSSKRRIDPPFWPLRASPRGCFLGMEALGAGEIAEFLTEIGPRLHGLFAKESAAFRRKVLVNGDRCFQSSESAHSRSSVPVMPTHSPCHDQE